MNKKMWVVLVGLLLVLLLLCVPQIFSFDRVKTPVAWTAAAPAQGVYVGIFRQDAPRRMDFIKSFEKDYGLHPSIVMWYLDWNSKFPKKEALEVIQFNAVPHLVWEPWIWGDEQRINLKNIIAGEWDSHIREFAKDVKSFDHPIFIRCAHEFNIEGYPWGLVKNNRDPQEYIQAYRHIVDIFRTVGARNVIWVWSPMNYSYPDASWNDFIKAYPGNDYVDWIGIDGYNWGSTQSWSRWQSFEDLFRESVLRVSGAFPDKPIMIAEFGSASAGGDKAEFFRRMPGYLKSSLKSVRAITYFDLNKEADWRIDSAPKTAEAFHQVLGDPIFLHAPDGILALKGTASKLRQRQPLLALRAVAPVKVNGALTEWGQAKFVSLASWDDVETGPDWQGKQDLSGMFALLWSPQFLYVAAKIYDDKPFNNSHSNENLWNGDAVELTFAGNAQADPQRKEYMTGDFQIGFGIGNAKEAKPKVWEWKQHRRALAEVQYVVAPMKGGYIIEAAIPLELLAHFKPTPGLETGFNFAFDDADDAQGRRTQMLWAGNYLFYKDPSVWGRVHFQ